MRYAILISAIVLFFSSCSNNSKNELAVFKATEDALERSNKAIGDASKDIYGRIVDKIRDPMYANYTLPWKPVADRISEYSSFAIDYIDKLKIQLLNAAGASMENKALVFQSNNFKAVNKIFFQQKKGDELYKVLLGFVDSIKNADPELNAEYDRSLKNNYEYLADRDKDKLSFAENFFEGNSSAGALAVLTKLENDIKNTEKDMLTYCYNRCSPGCILRYDKFQAIVGLSSSCVKAGDPIEITAGVGSFSTQAAPKFMVDNKVMNANEEGVVIYKFKTQLKAGKYTKPVTIEYTKPDGTNSVHTYTIDYTVIDPNEK